MDEDRRVRFLLAPVLFAASLLWGASVDSTTWDHVTTLFKDSPDWPKLIGLFAGGSIVVFAAGYIFGTVGYFVLMLIFYVHAKISGTSRFHEVALSHESFDQIWKTLKAPGAPDRSQELSAGGVFDHGVLRKSNVGVHRWLLRRWNAFSIGITSLCSLVVSFLFGWTMLNIPLTIAWLFPVGSFVVILLIVACRAWHDTMNMLAFMVSLPPKERKANARARTRSPPAAL